MITKVKSTQTEVKMSLLFLKIASGDTQKEQISLTEPDYDGYRSEKREIENMPLTPCEYEKAVKQAAKKYKI